MSEDQAYIKCDVPEGQSGAWAVERFVVRNCDNYDPQRDERAECAKRRPGTYSSLRRGTTTFMTDLYDEWWTQRVAIDEARRRGGEVLISGLGLGMVVESMLQAPAAQVDRVTVLELSRDVIRLVGPHLQSRYGDRLRIINTNAFGWVPPTASRYSVVWHDIWPNPHASEVTAEMERLEQRYQGCCDWQGCWPREYLAVYQESEISPKATE